MADRLSAEIEIAVDGAMGIICLDRPQAINALNGAMIETIKKALYDWQTDDKVRCVLIEGRGEKGLCAGGDVRAVRAAVLDGDIEAAHGFFAAEYEMNGLIATYAKPIMASSWAAVSGFRAMRAIASQRRPAGLPCPKLRSVFSAMSGSTPFWRGRPSRVRSPSC